MEGYMNKQLFFEFDENLINEATSILNYFGLDIQTCVKIFLTRVTNDKSITFLFGQESQAQIKPPIATDAANNSPIIDTAVKMTKNYALRLFANKGYNVAKNVTFASKNKSAYNYWANPNFDILNENWSLILNDNKKQKLYLFTIPAKTISKVQLTPRADMIDVIDLQIRYNDITFTDNRSGFSFAQFLANEIDY